MDRAGESNIFCGYRVVSSDEKFDRSYRFILNTSLIKSDMLWMVAVSLASDMRSICGSGSGWVYSVIQVASENFGHLTSDLHNI